MLTCQDNDDDKMTSNISHGCEYGHVKYSYTGPKTICNKSGIIILIQY